METELKDKELIKAAANFLLNDVAGQRKKDAAWMPDATLFATVVRKFAAGELASPQAKASLLSGSLVETASASMIPELVAKIIAAHPGPVADYKAGKTATLQFLVGMAMRESKGSANPGLLAEELKKALG